MIEKITMPKYHFRKRIKHQYSSIGMAICREILQNSQDAGATEVKFTFSDSGFSAQDNGCGMNLQEFRDFYLTLGGTKKESDSIGGFGAAKELLSFAWESWCCQGQGFQVCGSGSLNPESRPDDNLRRGFLVHAKDSDFPVSAKAMRYSLTSLMEKSNLKIKTIEVNGEAFQVKGRKLRKNQLFREYEFGKLYIHKSQPDFYESAGHLYIRTKGLYTGHSYIGGDYIYYLELDAASPEVLTENRDSLRREIAQRIEKDLQAITRKPESVESKPINPQLVCYGYDYSGQKSRESGQLESHELGCIDVGGLNKACWRKPFSILKSQNKINLRLGNGLLRPKFYKALEIWDSLLDMLAKELNLTGWSPSLVFNLGANGVNVRSSLGFVIGADPDRILNDDPFALLELAIHELAHCSRSGHSQEYESERMRIARTIAPIAFKVLSNISGWQQCPAQRGEYWV